MSAPARQTESSDANLLELLRQRGALSIAELSRATRVTATAVRQRLNRLMGQGLIRRETFQAPRGRPSHHYSLTEKARRQAGNNFPDLTMALWQEIRSITDPAVKSGLLKRLAMRLADEYSPAIRGKTVPERMAAVAALFAERNLPFQFEAVEQTYATALGTDHETTQPTTQQFPTLNVLACPYPELAEHDRGICAVENLMLTELLGERVKLTECRLDGSDCCRFQTAATPAIMPVEC